ncbi:hypothetical protein ABZY44_34395 [Streptomyces sp. NPDC006544]|uniref:hypothetical protein n=1 Tax=Streptomyces sp. NPDC006544 TaxID=3154583 RepID=UPI0033B0D45B
MAEGAYERGLGHAAPRVPAFAKLAEARAHGRTGDAKAPKAALGRTEDLLDSVRPGSHDPEQLAYMTGSRCTSVASAASRARTRPPHTHQAPCRSLISKTGANRSGAPKAASP